MLTCHESHRRGIRTIWRSCSHGLHPTSIHHLLVNQGSPPTCTVESSSPFLRSWLSWRPRSQHFCCLEMVPSGPGSNW